MLSSIGCRRLAGRVLRCTLPTPARLTVQHRSLAARAKKAKAPEAGEDEESQKAEIARKLMANLNKKFGTGTVMDLGAMAEDRTFDRAAWPSGCLPLDLILGGGWPKGRFVEIYGLESSGKSTLMMHALIEVLKKGGRVGLIDVENAFDSTFAASMGLTRDLIADDKMTYISPSSGDEALQIMDELIRSGVYDMIALDSVAALTPKSELEGEVGAQSYATQARLMGQALRKITSGAARSKCCVLFLNQIREKVGVIYGNPEVTPGGRALKFATSIRVRLRRREYIKDKGAGDSPVGIRVVAKTEKNKMTGPMKECEFDIMFDGGINAVASVVDAAVMQGVVEKSGSWFKFGEESVQGRDSLVELLEDDPELLAEVSQAVEASILETAAATAEKRKGQDDLGLGEAEQSNGFEFGDGLTSEGAGENGNSEKEDEAPKSTSFFG